ncbi:MAG: hypothetical protein RSE41_01395 [Clostridia bacterium]
MARAKRIIDKEEVDEIIYLKLKELGGMKKRLTYNSVFTFNKEIANNPKYKRENGDLFSLYGYDFWASSYNNEDYYGRQRINEIKNASNVVVAGKEFIAEVEDIHALVNEYYKKPEVLYKKLAKVFEMDKTKLKNLEEENKKLKKEKENLQKALQLFEYEFASIFCNSRLADNSLVDVISMNKTKDSVVYNSLKNMFKDDKLEEFSKTKEINNIEPNNVVSLKREERRRKRDDLF